MTLEPASTCAGADIDSPDLPRPQRSQLANQPRALGTGLAFGRCSGGPVTLDYAGVAPWAFTGGTIQEVVVDISGDHYVDLELEAIKAFKND